MWLLRNTIDLYTMFFHSFEISKLACLLTNIWLLSVRHHISKSQDVSLRNCMMLRWPSFVEAPLALFLMTEVCFSRSTSLRYGVSCRVGYLYFHQWWLSMEHHKWCWYECSTCWRVYSLFWTRITVTSFYQERELIVTGRGTQILWANPALFHWTIQSTEVIVIDRWLLIWCTPNNNTTFLIPMASLYL